MKRTILACTTAALLAAGCGHDHDSDLDAVYLDDASDEVLLTIIDEIDRVGAMVDDTRAARLTAPEDGAALPAGSPATFTWALPLGTLFHGVSTGEFVWVRLSCPGVDAPVDVFALDTTSWTADATRWDKLAGATGACTATVTTTYVDRGVIEEGPFRPSAAASFTIAR